MFNGRLKKIINSVFATFFISFLAAILINYVLFESTFAQTAEDYFQQGKSALEHNQLTEAHNNFQSALGLDPNHQGANLFFALTRILMISKSTAFNTLLDRAGVSSSGRDILNWTADFTRDAEGRIILPENTPTGEELQSFLKDNILPEITGALGNLSKVTSSYQTHYRWIFESGSGSVSSPNILTDYTKNWDFNELVGAKITLAGSTTEYTIIWNDAHTIQVSPNWSVSSGTYNYEIYDSIEIDYGDALVIKGLLYSVKSAINIISSYNVNIDIDTIFSLYNKRILSIQDHIINASTDLLKLLPTPQLSQAKSDLSDAISTLQSAINFIWSEGDSQEDDLFIIEDPGEEIFWRNLFDDINNSLGGTTYIRALEEYLNLKQFFDSPKNLRGFLPTFRGLFIIRDSFPDPTFGGILPNMTQNKLNQEIEEACILVGPLPGLVAYDDFSFPYIDKSKWREGVWVREIDNQKLVIKQITPNPIVIGSYPFAESNSLTFFDPESINTVQADISIVNYNLVNQGYVRARIGGRWYNDGTPGEGMTGDIWAAVELRASPTGLTANCGVTKMNNADGTSWTDIAWKTFSTVPTLGISYTLYISFDGNNTFTFKIGTETITLGPSEGVPTKAGGTKMPFKGIGTRASISNNTSSAFVSATFDNVEKNGALYDDFSSPTIDNTKWINYEFVREISDGQLKLKVRSSSAYTSSVFNRLRFLDPNSINFIQAKFKPIAFNNPQEADIKTRIIGHFYNDGTFGGGYLGEINAGVYIGYGIGVGGTEPKAGWFIGSYRDTAGNIPFLIASGVFNKTISMNTTYTLFLGWDGRNFIFKIDDEVVYYTPHGEILPPRYPWKEIGTRVLYPDGKEATIEVLIDDVMVGGPWTPKLLDPSGTVRTPTPMYVWEAVSGATSYRLYVNDSAGPNPKINQVFTSSETHCPSGFGECWVIPYTNLSQGDATWWVQASNSIGDSPWSIGMNFYVDLTSIPTPGKAILISPSGTISDNTPTYTWYAVPGATQYYLWVKDSTGDKIKQWFTASDAGCPTGTGVCSVTPSTQLANGTAIWWIQTYGTGGYGEWSEGMNFYVIPGCKGDFDGDGDVDNNDLSVFAADFGRTNCSSGFPCKGDFDGDGDVDGSDLAVFASEFGRTDCPR